MADIRHDDVRGWGHPTGQLPGLEDQPSWFQHLLGSVDRQVSWLVRAEQSTRYRELARRTLDERSWNALHDRLFWLLLRLHPQVPIFDVSALFSSTLDHFAASGIPRRIAANILAAMVANEVSNALDD